MTKTLSVSLSGTAISYLLYENTKYKFGQEGFLLGEIIEKTTISITDNDERQENVSKIIKINSAISCPQLCYFYDGIGQIDKKKLEHFLGNLTPKVIAWYRYRPMLSFKFSLREKIIHKQLAHYFNIQPEVFTCCLLISESSDNGSTYSFTQNFIRYFNNNCDHLPMHIINLSDSKNIYKSPEPASETFNSIIKDLKIDHKKSHGLVIITKIHNALQKHIDSLADDLSDAEERLFWLENEIKNTQFSEDHSLIESKSIRCGETSSESNKVGLRNTSNSTKGRKKRRAFS